MSLEIHVNVCIVIYICLFKSTQYNMQTYISILYSRSFGILCSKQHFLDPLPCVYGYLAVPNISIYDIYVYLLICKFIAIQMHTPIPEQTSSNPIAAVDKLLANRFCDPQTEHLKTYLGQLRKLDQTSTVYFCLEQLFDAFEWRAKTFRSPRLP